MQIGDGVVGTNNLHLPETVPVAIIIGKFVRDEGNNTIVGGGSILRSNIIDDDCVIGENCFLQDAARMERGSSLGSNSTLLPGTVVPSGQHWEGNPATFQGPAKTSERALR